MNEQVPTARLRPVQERAEPDAKPDKTPSSWIATWRTLALIATTGIFLILTIAGLYLARSILMPILAAVIVGITLGPTVSFAERYRIPPGVTATTLVLLLLGAVAGLSSLFAAPLTDWITNTPDLGEVIKSKLRVIEPIVDGLRRLAGLLSGAAGLTNQTVAVETSPAALVQAAVVLVTPAVTEVLLFFATLLFFLAGNSALRRKIVVSFPGRENRLRVLHIWADIEDHLMSYLGTVTVINFALGLVTAVTMYLLGIPKPVTWGVLAFVLNYIPYVGPTVVVGLLFIVGIVVLPSLGAALLAPGLFVVFTMLEGHFITPNIVGRRLTMSPFMVFLALAFWTWLWGPLGAFLATPLLIVLLVVLNNLFLRDELKLPG